MQDVKVIADPYAQVPQSRPLDLGPERLIDSEGVASILKCCDRTVRACC